MSADEFAAFMAKQRASAPKAPKGGRRGKFNVSPPEQRTWRGRTYASKIECQYAQHLRLDAANWEVIDQPKVRLGDDFEYRPDFLVIPRNGTPYYIDVKGAETADFRRIRKLWEKHGRLPLHIIKRKAETEILNGQGTLASS
jgi:predicted nuclease of restriction endonuclease-like RecB superfamily